MPRTPTLIPALFITASLVTGCSGDDGIGSDELNFSSDQATLLQFEFEVQFEAAQVWNMQRLAEDQLLYTIGHLNGDKAVGRFDKLELTNFERTSLDDARTRVSYHVSMPVAWGSKTNLPTSYSFQLPRAVDASDFTAFTDKYMHECVEWGAHDVDAGSMWYYYRPNRSGCHLDEADIVTTTATVTVSPENTEAKYPEYHEVWADGVLRVVAIFGKYEDGAQTASDAGISAYDRFVTALQKTLGEGVSTVPETIPNNPGTTVPDIEFRADLANGRKVDVVALLVDNVRTAGPEFDERYESLSGDADLIFYNGHAGLGANVRALAKKGKFKAGKYQIFFMNGCDSFAYVDGHLAKARAELNPDDPTGSRYMDMITNVMPSFFRSMPYASMAIIDGLLSVDEPRTYEQIFANVDKSEVIVVTGEEDNVYYPGYEPHGPVAWSGLDESGSLGLGESVYFATEPLPAGEYLFTMTEDPAQPGGDVDMYVAIDRQPTLDDWDFRPYEVGSNEQVTVTLSQPATIRLMLYGYPWGSTQSSSFQLVGKALND